MRTVAATLLALVVLGGSAVAEPSQVGPEHTGKARFDQPFAEFAPAGTVLRPASPEQAGLARQPIEDALARIAQWTQPDASGHPLFAGAVSLLASNGKVVSTRATGYALRYADGAGTELPADQRVPMRADTIFDMASVSKLFTSIVVMQQVEAGRVALDARVADYLPEFGVNGKADITVRQLLTHTSGLEPFLPLWRDWPDAAARIKAVMDVAPAKAPGSTYVYSDLNLITLGVLVSRVSGSTLDELVRDGITAPLGMVDTGYNPPASKLDRIAATEYQANPPRGMVRGQVHDENAWSLGGVAGHAGVFSTAADMAVLGQTILNGGSYAGHRILRAETVRQMLTNHNTGFPDDSHGLGFELDQRWYMGALTSQVTAGHTGYTGTTLVLDPRSRSVSILLTNRVHPSRNWGSINPARRALADGLANALAVRPRAGNQSWQATAAGGQSGTLTTPALTARAGALRVSFDAFVDVAAGDVLAVETSQDNGASWQPVSLRVSGDGAPSGAVSALTGHGHRAWWRVSAELPGNGQLRWRFTKGGSYAGRGAFVDDIQVRDGRGPVLNAERHPEALTAQSWTPVSR